MTRAAGRLSPRPIHLALQGGGAHGALTWGVLDRLIEDGSFSVIAVSGTSAGAMNAVALADGFARGGPDGARAALTGFWTAVGEAARVSQLRRSLRDKLGRTPGYRLLEELARLAPPGLLNPLGLDPLRAILSERIDFAAVAAGPIRVHVAATDVGTGAVRLFSGAEIDVEAVVASACLPQLGPAVEIDGSAFWDGGYSANPALLPLLDDHASRDILLVQLDADTRPAPRTARETLDRSSELAFAAPLLAELRMLDWAARNGADVPRLHRISGPESEAPVADRMDATPDHLQSLFASGRDWASAWLEHGADAVGAPFGENPVDPETGLRRGFAALRRRLAD